ncbi:hypothetical protein Poly51_38030 [Rubripirellula tenax]|uniref:Uncharacterized protein n=1 Tax=Rubripirellula tenax TaxID=2528015 RepID=A0A5C6ELB6_9BACT|nr:hypothetical protein Poly51_38030 [Rubripirellula tenax]
MAAAKFGRREVHLQVTAPIASNFQVSTTRVSRGNQVIDVLTSTVPKTVRSDQVDEGKTQGVATRFFGKNRFHSAPDSFHPPTFDGLRIDTNDF